MNPGFKVSIFGTIVHGSS